MDYQQFTSKYGLSLNPQQAEAVKQVEGSVLLLAVPGSGKTTVLVTRLGYMIECLGISPESILVMTYTVAATRDMKRRFASLFGEASAAGLEFRTINGVCAKIIRSYELKCGTTAFSLTGDEDESTEKILRSLYKEITGTFPTDGEIREVRTLITYAKNMLLDDNGIEKLGNDNKIREFKKIFEGYKKALRDRRLMDYDDQLVYALSILKKYPDILLQFRRRFKYICVDEAQDTSKIQHQIIDLLAGEDGNLFMVGDEDQSIYGFRAAYPEALVHFETRHKNAKILLMEENYRSGSGIVSAADAFIKRNRSRHDKSMSAVRGEGPAPSGIEVANRLAQYAYVASVAENCTRETAVLYRDNDCALPVIDRLARKGIPYRTRGIDCSFFTSRPVLELKDIVSFAEDRSDGLAFLNIYYKLSLGIKKEYAKKAVRDCPEGTSVLSYIASRADCPVYLRQNCRKMEKQLDIMLTENAADAVYRLQNFMGYGDYLEGRGQDMNKLEILKFIGRSEPDIRRLLQRLEELDEIVRKGSSDSGSLFVLSTVHSAKGLEFERVFLMDVFDGLLPKDPDTTDAGMLEEERRLFYVGMTRAKDELLIFTFKDRTLSSSFSSAVLNAGKKKKPAFIAPYLRINR